MCVMGTVNMYLFTLLNICTTVRTLCNAHSEGTYILHEKFTLHVRLYNVNSEGTYMHATSCMRQCTLQCTKLYIVQCSHFSKQKMPQKNNVYIITYPNVNRTPILTL
jgi:hypothetical protein